MPDNIDTLPGLIDVLADTHGDAPALVAGDSPTSFGELSDLSRRAATGLAALGIAAGDRVALWLPNGPEWLILWFACARLGAIAVAVNTRFRAAEVEDIVGRSGARALVLSPAFKGIDFAGILAGVDPAALGAVEHVITIGKTAAPPLPGRETRPYADLLAAEPIGRTAAAPEAGCIVFTTSGTTSKPKFVLQSQGSIARHARQVARAFEYDEPDSVLLQALPLCGTFGLAQAMGALAASAPSIQMPVFDAGAVLDLIRRHDVTSFNGSDEMFDRLMDAAAGPDDFASLRFCGYAAFANPEANAFVARGDAAGLTLCGLYGMSEVQALYARQPEDAPPEARAKAAGRLTSPGAAARARDPDSGDILPHGVAGELELAGPSRFSEYFLDAEATAAALTDDGYVRTGDLGYTEEDGGFVFLTRMGDSLRLGGFLVSPGEIDAWIERHPAVAACQTVAVETPNGLTPVAFVIPASNFEETPVLDHCREGLAGFKVPARILTLDAFPVTQSANGEKIQRGKLRDMAAAALAEKNGSS